jgi:hypothetical protein
MIMSTSITDEEVRSFCILEEIEIAAPLAIAFEALLAELGPESEIPGGKPFPMVIEPWPGGRWFRDLGNTSGHFWGHVQVIKPPTLLELCGPMFMSFPGVNHVQYRLIAEGNGTRLKLTHQSMGMIPEDLRMGVREGSDYGLKRISEIASRIVAKQRKEAGR